ncbi:hypothetical protein [Paraglaciecola sp. L1A13]|uniref:hypothetical protein n=1 Tax=Paraglaciecola sp. L1A13 TaxID=2686359 RepID=UPI00131DA3DC|nr:hypothetical protein [Paraglaciecola sp. L1A13]
MIRLTSRGWNNVLIISMLLLIIMFNLTGNIFSDSRPSDKVLEDLIPSGEVITSIDMGSTTLERVGRGWRLLPAEQGIDNQVLSEAISHWQSAKLEPIEHDSLTGAKVVNVWLAGQSAPRRYLFFQMAGDMFVQYPVLGTQLYKVTNMTWPQLFLMDIPHA